jgi:hypothetical protein
MKLLLENWRKYLTEESEKIFGRDENPSVNDIIKMGGFPTFKLPDPIQFKIGKKGQRIEPSLEKPEEGFDIVVDDGYFILGPGPKKGEYWQVPPHEIHKKYIVDMDKMVATPRSEDRYAVQMNNSFTWDPPWGAGKTFINKANDFLVRYGDGDYGGIDYETFLSTYDTTRMKKK